MASKTRSDRTGKICFTVARRRIDEYKFCLSGWTVHGFEAAGNNVKLLNAEFLCHVSPFLFLVCDIENAICVCSLVWVPLSFSLEFPCASSLAFPCASSLVTSPHERLPNHQNFQDRTFHASRPCSRKNNRDRALSDLAKDPQHLVLGSGKVPNYKCSVRKINYSLTQAQISPKPRMG